MRLISAFLFLASLFLGCHKDKDAPPPPSTPTSSPDYATTSQYWRRLKDLNDIPCYLGKTYDYVRQQFKGASIKAMGRDQFRVHLRPEDGILSKGVFFRFSKRGCVVQITHRTYSSEDDVESVFRAWAESEGKGSKLVADQRNIKMFRNPNGFDIKIERDMSPRRDQDNDYVYKLEVQYIW